MNHFYRFLFTVLLALSAPASYASGIDQLHNFLSQTSSARGEFTQRQEVRAGAKAKPESSGYFAFQRPGKFRWVYLKPYEQTIVGDGAALYMYDKDLNQVTVKKLQAALPASPASILFGSNDFERDFEVNDDGAHDGLQWILAKPRAKDSNFEQIRIGFADGLPGAMQLNDSFGQKSTLTFSKVERNPKLEGDAFKFAIPKGADVLTDR